MIFSINCVEVKGVIRRILLFDNGLAKVERRRLAPMKIKSDC